MSSVVVSAVQSLWMTGRKTKRTSGGWIAGNAPCCHHNGERPDTKGRGGILVAGDSFRYHCFNCSFSAGHSPGKNISSNTRKLLSWLGLSEDDIKKLALDNKRAKEELLAEANILSFDLPTVKLPENCTAISKLMRNKESDSRFLDAMEYVSRRGFSITDYNWQWTPLYPDRVIIPFYNEGKVVGWTGRRFTDEKPKYLTHSDKGYVFNMDAQSYDRQFVIVVEGQFDAIAVGGVAIMHNNPSVVQCARINSLGREVIVVPDRDAPGDMLIEAALKNNWHVSMPPWDPDIKDVADAAKRYGKLYTIASILHYKETSHLKIKLLQKIREVK